MIALVPLFFRRPSRQKVVVVVGPTASGKSSLAVKLAQKFRGIVIGADSRQIYRRLDIATAKPTKEERSRVPHFMIDVVEPDEEFNVAIYQNTAYNLLERFAKENLRRASKVLPIIVGGTGLYIKAIVDGLQIPRVSPDQDLRKKLEEKTLEELKKQLLELDPTANVDLKNKRRLIRALEVILSTGQPFSQQRTAKPPEKFEFLQIGIDWPREELYQRINERVDEMTKKGLLKEAKELFRAGYDFTNEAFTALGYRHLIRHLQKKISRDKAVELMKRDHRHYARKQLSWFKKDKRVHWVKNLAEAEKLVAKFLRS